MSRHYHSKILLIILKSQGNICIIHILYAFVQNNPPPFWHIPVHSHISESVKVQVHVQCTYNLQDS